VLLLCVVNWGKFIEFPPYSLLLLGMKLFVRGKKDDASWLAGARELCRSRGIKIMAWGPNMLVVEAKTGERACEIARELANLGFETIKDENDSNAGLLSLCHPG